MNAIFAINALGGFGLGNTMPWTKSTSDLKRFKNITNGNTVVMGANTWNSNIPKPFPNRRNCVLSSTLVDNRCEIFRNVNQLFNAITEDEKVFVIGGATILWELRPVIKTIYLTTFDKSYDQADVVMDINTYLKDYDLISGEIYSDHKFEMYKKML